VITVQQAPLAGVDTILRATYLTIGLSVFAHGVTAAPPAKWSSSEIRGEFEGVITRAANLGGDGAEVSAPGGLE